MALLNTVVVTIAGVLDTVAGLEAVNASDTITADSDNLFLHVHNGNAGTLTVTLVDAGKTPSGSSATNPTVSLATTVARLIKLPRSLADPTTGLITVQYSPTSSVVARSYKF